jgi:DNA-binding GntR family transcriptional regulator
VETDVAARLGVSRTPVRGALQRLQHEGYIVDSPSLQQSRPTVAPLTQEDMRELFYIVGEIEGLAALFAAQLPTAQRNALTDELTSLNDSLKKASEVLRPNHSKLWELDERFHRRYVEASSGARLVSLHDAVKPQAERYERIYVSFLANQLATSVAEHRAITRAIKAGDASEAQRAVQTNWRNASERLGSVIEAMGERGKW